jgi:hypothetical protein
MPGAIDTVETVNEGYGSSESVRAFEPPMLWALKQSPLWDPRTRDDSRSEEDDPFGRIRCPLCRWQPTPVDTWCCDSSGPSPEQFFGGCGTVWNTFATRGRCPGCDHQWRWTVCLRCHGWSLHDDWYDVGEP